jgi:hypothetical protein
MGRLLPVRVLGPGTLRHPNHDLRADNGPDDGGQVGRNARVDGLLADWREIRLPLWSDRFRARFGT